MPVGSVLLDFGTAAQRQQDVSAAVTGQTAIAGNSVVEAWMMADSSADNDPDAHVMAASMVALVCRDVVAGTGFTIQALGDGTITGTFLVRWVWN
jgi:hypothetical protein